MVLSIHGYEAIPIFPTTPSLFKDKTERSLKPPVSQFNTVTTCRTGTEQPPLKSFTSTLSPEDTIHSISSLYCEIPVDPFLPSFLLSLLRITPKNFRFSFLLILWLNWFMGRLSGTRLHWW